MRAQGSGHLELVHQFTLGKTHEMIRGKAPNTIQTMYHRHDSSVEGPSITERGGSPGWVRADVGQPIKEHGLQTAMGKTGL